MIDDRKVTSSSDSRNNTNLLGSSTSVYVTLDNYRYTQINAQYVYIIKLSHDAQEND